MKWFILVLFFNQPDFYVFTEPTFDSEDVCVGSITDPQHYPILVEKLLQELISSETNKKYNQFSIIHYNKLKLNAEISG